MFFMDIGREVDFKEPKDKYIYLLKEDKILKLVVRVDLQIIKRNFIRLLKNLDEKSFITVDKKNFEQNKFPDDMFDLFYVGKYRLNKLRKTENYKIPNFNYIDYDLIYILNSIYNKPSLECDDLWGLNNEREYHSEFLDKKFSKVSMCVIEDIVSNLNINIVEEYDYNKLLESLEYVEHVRNKEKLFNTVNLKNLKNILYDAQGNKDVFEELNISVPYENEKQKVK